MPLQALICTDVVESTRLAESLGEESMKTLWRKHDRQARDLIAAWRGREIEKTDGLLAIFDSPADAANFSLAYHRALAKLEPPLRARAGMHVAAIELRPNPEADQLRGAIPLEVEGIAKPIVARTMAAAIGGQTLMTSDARLSLGVTRLRTQSHGHWRFKGLSEPIELFEVGDDASPFVPPPDSEKAHRVVRVGDLWQPAREIKHNLPAERNRFVGRGEPLEALSGKIDAGTRLTSVLGTGGTGKTRLAIHFAWVRLWDFPGGVWFCDLSQARTLDGIYFEVAQALGVPLGKTDPQIQLAHAIAGRGRCLVVLDNFEQVARHAEETVGVWLDRAAQATFLVTTREVLSIPGEDVLALGPLPSHEAVSLFLRRVEASNPAYRHNPENEQLVKQLVAMLDGLPLAIELAAARSRVMSLGMLLERMTERFKLLWATHGRGDRQSTLRATFDWSWQLLTETERSALAQLSVFEGGFTLISAQQVVDLSTFEGEHWMLDVLQGLSDKSLIRRTSDDRFDLLESIREYGAARLRDDTSFRGSGLVGARATQARHCRYFAQLDERGAAVLSGLEANNLVLACRRAVELADPESAAGALRGAWAALRLRGPFQVAVQLAIRVAGLSGLDAEQQMSVDWVAGSAHHALGKVSASRPWIEAGLIRARTSGDRRRTGQFLCVLAEQLAVSSDPLSASPALTEALSLSEELQDDDLTCRALSCHGNICFQQGKTEEARAHYEMALAVARRVGDDRWLGGILGNLGNLAFSGGELDVAERLYRQSLELACKTGDGRWEANMHCNLGMVHLEQGRIESARLAFDHALTMSRAMGHARTECTVLCNLGIALEALGKSREARARYEEAVHLAQELADRRSEGQFRGYLGLLLARTGNTDAGLACLGVGEQLLLGASDQLSLGLLLCRRAEAEHRVGHAADAAHALGRVESIVTSAKASPSSELGKALKLLADQLSVGAHEAPKPPTQLTSPVDAVGD